MTLAEGHSYAYANTSTTISSTIFIYTLTTYVQKSTATYIEYSTNEFMHRMLQSKLTSTLIYTLTNVVSSYTTITYAIETNEIYYISVSSTPTMFPVYTETDFTTYDTIPSTYPLPESTIILPQDKTKNLLDRTNTYVPTFESKETIVHKPIPYQLTLNSSTLYMYSTETTIYTSTYTADINSSVIFKYTEVTTYTDTIISYNPINHQDGELNVTSYSFIDVNTTTRTVVFNVKETQLEIKTISYKLLNSVLTISSAENNSINTYVWDASQVASGAFYSTYACLLYTSPSPRD